MKTKTFVRIWEIVSQNSLDGSFLLNGRRSLNCHQIDILVNYGLYFLVRPFFFELKHYHKNISQIFKHMSFKLRPISQTFS